MTTQADKNQECCPKFDPIPWDDKVIEWHDKKFIKDRVCTLFYMPLNFGGVMKRLGKVVEEGGANANEWLCLSDHTSLWNMDIYLAVDKDLPEVSGTSMSGTFYSKVYEGSYNNISNWTKDFNKLLKSKGLTSEKMYMWYTTCPKCAKKYGKNFVVLISKFG